MKNAHNMALTGAHKPPPPQPKLRLNKDLCLGNSKIGNFDLNLCGVFTKQIILSALPTHLIAFLPIEYTTCPRNSNPLYTTYYIKWVTTLWTDGIFCSIGKIAISPTFIFLVPSLWYLSESYFQSGIRIYWFQNQSQWKFFLLRAFFSLSLLLCHSLSLFLSFSTFLSPYWVILLK